MTATMFDFGPEFINAGLYLTPTTSTRSVASINGWALQLLSNRALPLGGGYIYFPPGRYFIGRPFVTSVPEGVRREEQGDIVIAPNVTLWFAPGAVLIPSGNAEIVPGRPDPQKVRIEIQGDIIAELQQIFSVVMNPLDAEPTAGTILLTSHRIREVYPEWWGAVAGGLAPRQTAMAIQAAIDAAYHNRNTRRLDANGVPLTDTAGAPVMNRRSSIPVVLRGDYVVDRELTVGLARESIGADVRAVGSALIPTGGFELRGETSVGGTTLGASAHMPGARNEAILAIRGPTSFSIRDVSFSANFNIARCVAVEPIVGEWGYSAFNGCEFRNALEVLIQLDAETRRQQPHPLLWQAKKDFWNITFTRCTLFPIATNEVTFESYLRPNPVTGEILARDEEGQFVAVDVKLGDNEGLEFQGCWFRGPVSPAIRAFSGRFAVNACNFHVVRPLMRRSDTLVNAFLNNDFRHGTDISIEPVAPEGFPGRVVPATFTAREVDTHSIQFLVTPSPRRDALSPPDLRRSAVVLFNVSSSVEIESQFFAGGQSLPPGIYWGHPGRSGCALVMMGCTMLGFNPQAGVRGATQTEWRDAAGRPLNRHAVYYEPPLLGDIYDVASNMIATDAEPGRMVFSIDPAMRSHRIRRLQLKVTLLGLLGP